MSAHVDLDVLAEHLEGVLDDEAAAEVEAHLATCAACAERVDALRGVGAVLGRQEQPAMPPHVQQRLEEAIREEASGVVSLQGVRRRRGRLGRALLAAAAAVVVVAVGGTVLSELGPLAGQSGQGDAVSGRAEPAPEAASAPEADGGADQEGLKVPQEGPTSGEPPAVAPQDASRTALIERVLRIRAVLPLRQRAACVGAALGDPGWAGTSYAVRVDGGPGAVAFLGDAVSTQREVTGALVTCRPQPRVLERTQLSR